MSDSIDIEAVLTPTESNWETDFSYLFFPDTEKSCSDTTCTASTISLDIYPQEQQYTGGVARWKRIEDIFLAGLISDTYMRRHSLKPFRSEKTSAKRKGESVEKLVWNDIHKRYMLAVRRYGLISGEILPPRTVRAIQKRWKLGDNSNDQDIDVDGSFFVKEPQWKRHLREWDNVYNAQYLLTCTESDFNRFLQKDGASNKRRKL